jgi:hypothetical protein
MKRLGKAVILTFAEYESLMCRTEDAEAHADDFAEELSDKPVVTGATKAVMAATEAPKWCPLWMKVKP